MRVVHVTPYFAPAAGFGGPPRSLLALCRAQRAAGIDVEVFTTTASRGRPLEARPNGVEVEGVPVRRFALGWPRGWLGAPSMAWPLGARVRKADVVHLHGLFNRTIWMAGAAVRRAGVPYVISPRGMLEPAALAHHAWRKRVAFALRDGAILRGAAAWHATSAAEADTLRARPDARPVVEIPNSVVPVPATAAARETARRAIGLTRGEPFLLFLGRLHPIKRLDLLAGMFAHVSGAHPGAHLVIAGADEGGYRERVSPLFAPLAPRVHWPGEVDGDVKAGLLAEARALVLCSDSESFGMSVAEALLSSTPAIVTRTCPWPSIEAARAGFWVAQNPGALAAAAHRVLEDAALATAMGARGRDLIVREFGAEAIGARWRACYESIATGRGAASRA